MLPLSRPARKSTAVRRLEALRRLAPPEVRGDHPSAGPAHCAPQARFGDDVDLVNGYKISRSDPMHRIVIGRVYHHTVKLLFGLTVRDEFGWDRVAHRLELAYSRALAFKSSKR